MKMVQVAQIEKRPAADALIIPFWKEAKNLQPAVVLSKEWEQQLAKGLTSGDFKAKEGECLYLYLDHSLEKRVVLLGLGELKKNQVETLRRAYGCLAKSCLAKRLVSLNLLVPQT